MKYTALVTFIHDELGRIKKGETVDANKTQAASPLILGYFAPVEKPAEPVRKTK